MSIPKEKMTAWQRWEMADFTEPKTPVATVAAVPAQEPEPLAAPPLTEPDLPAVPAIQFPTLDELEQIHQQAQKDGFAAGYDEGTARVRMEALRINSLAEQLEHSLKELDKDVADELLALALEVARQVVREHLAIKPDAVLAVVREALLQLPHLSATIYLHPEDATLVRTHLGEQLTNSGHRIMHDPTMTQGGCTIEAEGTQVDASLETRWRRVLDGFGAKSEWKTSQDEADHETPH